ncbi:MAG TPA: hypothetical protein VHC49_14940 [Mycobacteriales bacterium]|nr:hypothetical protein [Mycobacteriales bacterium]
MAPKDIDVDPAGLQAPAARFSTVSGDLGKLDSEVATQMSSAGGDSGNGTVADACSVFCAGIQAALTACKTDTQLFSTKVKNAGVSYKNMDTDAYHVTKLQTTRFYPCK